MLDAVNVPSRATNSAAIDHDLNIISYCIDEKKRCFISVALSFDSICDLIQRVPLCQFVFVTRMLTVPLLKMCLRRDDILIKIRKRE